MKIYELKDHQFNYLPEGHDWVMVWNDEFDGDTLDESKWDFRLNRLMTPQAHYSKDPRCVHLDGNSNVVLSCVKDGDQYISTQLQTGENFTDRPSDEEWPIAKLKKPKFAHRYGYYEIRARLQKQRGWWSAFWLQSPTIGCCLDPERAGVELDIMESFEPEVLAPHTIHWNGYGADHENIDSNHRKVIPPEINTYLEPTEDGFHRFGMHWEKDGYTFYVDGKQSGMKIPGPVSHVEQFILISTECDGYRYTGYPTEDLKKIQLPDEFIVDYVRVFDEVEK